MTFLQSVLLNLLRTVGGFSLARHLTRKRLRILCYHGFAIGDEFRVLPFMFMRRETFERRMQILKRRAFPVITLDAAVKRLQNGSIENAETVITMDDGWASNLAVGLPILEQYGYPVCIYVNTEHLSAGPEAFNVALYYMIRMSSQTTMTIAGVHPDVDGTYNLCDPESAVTRLIFATERVFSLAERQRLLGPLALALGLKADDVFRDGRFLFLSAGQIQSLAQRGVDIELHTHTHRLPPDDFEAAALEISRNRDVLRTLIGRDAHHFCYPSGFHDPVHPGWLQKLDITSATTCDPGLNTTHTSPLLLKRFLDSDKTTDLYFEAEICGVRDLIRNAMFRLRRVFAP
jgi:peptidoglycan/xylan/chitin deacetylase (PgdA/CDA1 family)